MATISVTGTPDVLGLLPTIGSSFALALADGTGKDNGDGTWTVTAMTAEENIPALAALGATVNVLEDDDAELAAWQELDNEIDNEPPVS
jgi:hypothetical protein